LIINSFRIFFIFVCLIFVHKLLYDNVFKSKSIPNKSLQ